MNDYFKGWYKKNRDKVLERRKKRYQENPKHAERVLFISTLTKRFHTLSRRVGEEGNNIYLDWADFIPLLGRWKAYRMKEVLRRPPTLEEYVKVYQWALKHRRPPDIEELYGLFEAGYAAGWRERAKKIKKEWRKEHGRQEESRGGGQKSSG